MQPAVQPGEVLLGKYRVERVLGEGGMGIVLAVRHAHLNELFAIKMMLPAALAHQDAVERFLREARAAARLKGEHVARVHDVGALENGAPYMVMEHLAGKDRKEHLKTRGALPLDEAALLVYQACEAVSEAHANGIIHRDLKPANLFLIRRPNGTPCIKVLDFGISKELDPTNSGGLDLTKPGAFMGSPLYMSPEQMANIKATDMRSDIWSLGVILYELVTGTVPFGAEAMTELVTKVLTAQPLPPSQLRPGVLTTLETTILRCLEKRPEHRFQSVQDFMTALRPFTTGNVQSTMMGGVQGVAAPPPARVSYPDSTMMLQQSPLNAGHTEVGAPIGQTNQLSDSGRLSAPSGQFVMPGSWSSASGQFVAPPQGSQTGGGFSNTSVAAPRKSKAPMFAAIGILVIAGGIGIAALAGSASGRKAPASSGDAAPIALPTATQATTVPQTPMAPKDSAPVATPATATAPVARTTQQATTTAAAPTGTATPPKAAATAPTPQPTATPAPTPKAPSTASKPSMW